MPEATRKGDKSTGHDACSATALVEGSPDVFINGLPAGRVGDKYASHSCFAHAAHQDNIAEGSATVFINGLAAGRKGDAVKIGDSVKEGSPDVVIGG